MVCPAKWKNLVLFAGSLAFYFYGVRKTPVYLILFLISLLLNWYLGAWMIQAADEKHRKQRLFAGVLFNLCPHQGTQVKKNTGKEPLLSGFLICCLDLSLIHI